MFQSRDESTTSFSHEFQLLPLRSLPISYSPFPRRQRTYGYLNALAFAFTDYAARQGLQSTFSPETRLVSAILRGGYSQSNSDLHSTLRQKHIWESIAPFLRAMQLPSHPASTVSDPLSILDSNELYVPFWIFLQILFQPILSGAEDDSDATRVKRFVGVLETISYSVTGNGSSNFLLLSEALSEQELSEIIKPVVEYALDMSQLFPEGELPMLPDTPSNGGGASTKDRRRRTFTMSDAQTLCLVCHMLLGTLAKPPWMSWDGPNLTPSWLADDDKGDRDVKQAYIRVLHAYLREKLLRTSTKLGNGHITLALLDADESEVEARLRHASEVRVPLIRLRVFQLDLEDDDLEEWFVDHTEAESSTPVCQLISANKEIGFGPAATQEERIYGSNPCLLPTVLLAPVLSPTQGLLVSGDTEVYGAFSGHLRTARLRKLYSSSERMKNHRTGRSYLFLDALEMDEEKHGKDFERENMLRELRKLTSGFAGLEHGSIVVCPPWGCGTFGGDFTVKLLLIWMASSMCGITELRVPVKGDWWETLSTDWRKLLETMESDVWDVGQVWKLLGAVGERKRAGNAKPWLDE